jgi:putative ABC transport system permease protein
MRLLRAVRMRLRALLRPEAVDHELTDELTAHLEQLADEKMADGLGPDAAREAARREFGSTARIVEQSRDVRGITAIVNAVDDVRYGLRLIRRTPAFTICATLTIALGMAATTTMFSVVYGVVLRPLPYRDPGRLVNIWTAAPRRGFPRAYVGMANFYDWRSRSESFEDMAALRPVANFNLTGEGEPVRLNGSRVSSNLFSVLGVTPLLGRVFTAEEDQIGHETVALLSHGLWVSRFGSDPTVVGRTILLNGIRHAVVGVMQPEFAFPSRDFEIYVPLTFDPDDLISRLNYSFMAVGRLKSGVSIEHAQAEISLISDQLEREHPRENEGIGAVLVPLHEDTVGNVRRPLLVLLASVVAMLLIGCANLTNLILARSLARRNELALRSALGASRRRLVAQSIGELVPIFAAGGTLGLLITTWGVSALVPLLPADLPRVESISLHLPVLGVTAVTLAAIVLFVAVWPAIEASRGEIGSADLSRGITGALRRSMLRDGLVVAQIGTTLWLVISASLLIRSLAALRQVNPGFRAQHVYTLHLAIPRTRYPKDRDVAAFTARILERVQALPDVSSAGMVNRLPLAGGTQTGLIEFEGVGPEFKNLPNVDYRTITPDYFRTLGIPLVSGRTFTERDDDAAPGVAIIDEQLARTVFQGADALGRRVRIPVMNLPWLTIVGVAGHIRHDRLDEDTRPQIYFSYRQRTQDRMALAVRTRSEPDLVAPALVAAIHSVDPEQPVYDARPLEAVIDRAVAQRWLQAVVLGSFATVALVLASIGVYGVIAYGVGQRSREFGIRMALGARRREIVALVLRRGAMLFGAGALVGLAAAALSLRVFSSLLYNVRVYDPFSFAAATIVMLSVALVACSLPAQRAARLDPSVTLRAE